ncbi:MAG: homoserine dehydrogenase [Peptococcaceae bacterium]|nr:homoserine dehydrogenase [Peptococcaceae bacterium]
MEKKILKAGLLGLGTVGTGVYKLFEAQKEEMIHKIGAELELKKILVRPQSMERAKGIVREGIELTSDWRSIVEDEEIDIIIEVMGGTEFAKECILAALNAGKSVVTSNKDLVAIDGKELLDTAAANNCDFLFEAAVAGGIPIIRPLKQCLAGNHLTEVMGIINGTTNFILTKMTLEDMDYQEALALATELGYAEADPTADVEGIDAARKVAILASIAFNSRVVLGDVYTEGITRLTKADIEYAKEMGWTIKLIGMARNTETGIEVRVHPMLIPSTHPLASVNDSFNAVFVHGDAVDDAMFYGRGAGELPTASAIMGDVMDIARDIRFNCKARINCTCYKQLPIKTIDECNNSYYIRLMADNQPGVLSNIAKVFGDHNVSIAQFIQRNAEEYQAEMVLITENVLEKDFNAAMEQLKALSIVKDVSAVIRVYGKNS